MSDCKKFDTFCYCAQCCKDGGCMRKRDTTSKSEGGAQYKQLEALIVEVIRRCGVKGGVAPETYGAMCEGVREILRLAERDGRS